DFAAGQTITIDAGGSQETAVIATVGTGGSTTVSAAIGRGATVIPVAGAMGFSAGQTVTIGSGESQATAVIASFTGGRGGASITLAASLASAHAAGSQVSGSGITLTTPLIRAHAGGVQAVVNVPTPGAPNRYSGSRP